MPWAVAGAVVGGLIAADGSKSAANTQAKAAQAANDTNLQMFNTQVGLNAPFRDTGLAANNRLASLLGLSPTQSSPQTLTQGADGVFSPTPSIGPSAPQGFNEQAYLQANPDVAQYIQSHPPGSVGYTTALQHYQTFGQQEGRSLGTPQQAPPAIATAGQPAGANDLSSFGSANQAFNTADFSADGAPKTAPFDQYGGAQNLSGFQDMPAFNPDMMKEDPGYQFRLDQGMKGVQNSAAAKGGLFSGAAGKALTDYGQNYASGEYQNAFNRYQTTRGNNLQDYLTNRDTSQLNNTNKLQTYTTNLGTQQANRSNALGDYSGAFDRFQTNRNNVVNPLLSMMGYGQQATGATSAAAQNYGQQATSAITGAGNAVAAGQVGGANALGGAFSGASNAYSQNQLMNLLLSRNNNSAGPSSLSNLTNGPMGQLFLSSGSLGD